jgi:V/A-type H+-transporting ATPase subunit C
MSQNPDYGFAIGRVRSLETALLDRNRYDRLVRTRGRDEFLSVLTETAYGRYFEGDRSGQQDIERALAAAADENFEFFRQYCLDDWLLELLQLPEDFHNLKVVLKRRLLGEETSADELLPHGRWGRDQLDALATGTPGAQPAEVSEAVRQIVVQPEASRDPARIDMALDRLLLGMTMNLARPSDYMTGYCQLYADMENLRSLVRVKATSEPATGGSELTQAFLPGGTLRLARLASFLAGDWESLIGGLASTRFRGYIEQGVGEMVRRQTLLRMERLGREEALRYLRQSRYATFGYEPLVTFHLLHKNESRNLRLLYAAKQAGLPDAETLELIAHVD